MNLRRWTPVVLTALACATVGHSQTTSGGARGVVVARGGKPLASASVVIRNLESGLTRTLTTGAQGEYSFVLLPVGPYEMTVSAPGMRTAKDSRVSISLGQNTVANFTMDVAEAAATVEVTAAGAALDTREVNVMTAVNDTLVQAVPLRERNFIDLVALTPMAALDPDGGRISVGGARGIQNNLTIDGASYQSNFFGEQRGSTRIPFAFGADTVKEIQIITNGYDAQYGNAAGAIINAVTKTGTNTFSGTILAQFRPSSLVAKIRPVPYDPNRVTNTDKARTKNFSQQQFNFNVGGPIIKDKLHFFVGVETYRFKEDFTPGFGITSSNTQAGLDAFLVTFGKLKVGNDGRTLAQENGFLYTNDRNNKVYFGRLDWTISDNHRATLRVNAQDWKSENGTTSFTSAFAPVTGQSNQGLEKNSGLSWVFEFNSVIGANVVNEMRLQRAIERRPRFANSTASPEIQINSGFTAGQNNFLPNGLDEFTWQFVDNLTWTKGDWTVKGGVDLQAFRMANTFFRYQGGRFVFGNYDVANRWAIGSVGRNPTTGQNVTDTWQYVGSYSDFGGTIEYNSKLLSGYLQSQYSGLMGQRMTLNFGLRYTREQQPENPRPNPVFAGLDQAASSNAADPRFGFTYDINGDQKTLLRGGYGHFSNPNPSLTVSNTMNSNGRTTATYFIAGSINQGTSPASLVALVNSGLLSYAQRVTAGGTELTRLNPALLATLGTTPSLTGQVWDPNNKLPVAKRTSLGVEHRYDNGLQIGLMGVYTKFENMQFFKNINLWQLNSDGTANLNGFYNDGWPTGLNRFQSPNSTPAAGLPAARPGKAIVRGRYLDLSSFGNVALSSNTGQGTYSALVVTASKFSDKGYGFQSSLTFAQNRDNNTNERDTFGTTSSTPTPADPMATYGYADTDRRLRFTFAGYFPVIWGIQGSVNYSYTSGRPWTAVYTTDINGDNFSNDVVYNTQRNGFRQPGMKTMDLRLSRDFRFSKQFGLETFIDVFNVFNWQNLRTSNNGYASNTTNSPFASWGQLDLADRNTREVQFGIRFKF